MDTSTKTYSFGAEDIFLKMGGLGLILFAPAYTLLKSGFLNYNTLLFLEGIFFANPHLFSSYLRTYTENNEFQRYKFLNIYLPILLVLGLSGLVFKFGNSVIWMLGTLYFYWQWWHHARQSYGIGKNYQRHLEINSFDQTLNNLTLWAWAIFGICLKSNVAHDYYEGLPIRVLHLPENLTAIIFTISVAISFVFIFRQLKLYIKEKIIQIPFLTHLGISSFVFICFFGLLPTDLGIIAASFWHCTQYMSYVKDHQYKKAANGLIPNTFWNNLFKNENSINYFLILLILSLSIFVAKLGVSSLQISALILGFSMTLTFHHYLLDGIIWSKNEVMWSYLPSYREKLGQFQGNVYAETSQVKL